MGVFQNNDKRTKYTMNRASYAFYSLLLGLSLLLLTACEKSPFDEKQDTGRIELRGSLGRIEADSLYTYADIRVGRSQDLTFTLTNRGSKSLKIGQVSTDNKDYTVVRNFDKDEIRVGERITFTIRFDATKGGYNATNIAFMSSDEMHMVFRFRVRFFVREAPTLTSFGNVSTPDGLNTIDLRDGEAFGTRFLVELPLNDPNEVVNPATVELLLEAKFQNTDEVIQIVKRGFELTFSPDRRIISYTFAARFGESEYIDLTAWIRLPTGDVSNKVSYRLQKPEGAN
jgi:hypothetical protein